MRVLPVLCCLLAGCGSAPDPRPLRDFRCVIHVHSAWSHDSKGRMEEILAAMKRPDFLARAARRLKEDPDHLFLELLAEPVENLARWAELNRSRRIAMIAGNDAHQNVDIGGLKLDPYERSLGFVTTHVLAP